MKNKIPLFISVVLFALILIPFMGSEKISIGEIFADGSFSNKIFFNLRLPRLLFTLLLGGSLAILGATYQTLFHNPIAEPYVLGISSAVTLGIVIGETVLKWPPLSFEISLLGIAMAGICILFLLSLQYFSSQPMERVLLLGLALNFVLSSSLFLLLSYHEQQVGGSSIRWLFGNIPWVHFSTVGWLYALSIPFIIYFVLFSRKLDVLSLGDEVALSMGVSPTKERFIFLTLTSILLAILTSFSGTIGFIGVVAPHAIRMLFHPATHRKLFLMAFLLGGFFLSFSDVISRTLLPPIEFPIGVITAVIGGPLFLVLLWKK